MSEPYLLLKWGSVKGWGNLAKKDIEILQKWSDLGRSSSAMMQDDSQEQKDILCELINQFDGEIQNDWSGDKYTKEEAVKYIKEYRS